MSIHWQSNHLWYMSLHPTDNPWFMQSYFALHPSYLHEGTIQRGEWLTWASIGRNGPCILKTIPYLLSTCYKIPAWVLSYPWERRRKKKVASYEKVLCYNVLAMIMPMAAVPSEIGVADGTPQHNISGAYVHNLSCEAEKSAGSWHGTYQSDQPCTKTQSPLCRRWLTIFCHCTIIRRTVFGRYFGLKVVRVHYQVWYSFIAKNEDSCL